MVLPAGMVKVVGAEAIAPDPLITISVTCVSTGKGRLKLRLPCALLPPVTVPGVKVKLVSEFAFTVRVPVLLPPLAVAETFTVVLVATGLVTRVKLADELPASTVTELGMEATALLPLVTARVTVVSAAGAALRVTVPVLLPPPVTELGENVNDFGMLGFTVKLPVTLVPLALAEILTVALVVTAFVTTGKVAVELPMGTVTELGMEPTAEPPLVTASETTVVTGAGAAMVTVPVVEVPPKGDVGLKTSELGISGVSVSTLESVAPP